MERCDTIQAFNPSFETSLDDCAKLAMGCYFRGMSAISIDATNHDSGASSSAIGPFITASTISLPARFSHSLCFENTNFIQRRNERERARVRNVNDGFERLRHHLPLTSVQRDKRLSKVETLRMAINYIRHLENVLNQC